VATGRDDEDERLKRGNGKGKNEGRLGRKALLIKPQESGFIINKN
jgi:hypothetical protein